MTPFTVPGFMRLAFTIFVGIGFLLLGLGGCNVGEQGGGNPGSGANGTEDTDVNVDADDPTDTGSGVNGADDDDSTTQDNTGTDTGEAGKIIAEPVDDASYLFAPDEIRTYELLLSKADLSFLNSAPAAEEYVEGKLVFEGKTISPVGIRYKGSIGAFGMCTGFGWGPNGGRKTCPKLSMKVKINWEGSDARFYGLKKLQFHSMNTDDSLMREQLGYYAFRAMGVASPRTAHVRLLINGKFEGVFLLVEQIDGCFTRSRFSEGGKGNLYKEIWPVTTRERPYIISLRTNEDENPSVDRPIALARELKDATPEERFEIVEYWMDLDYSLRYLVVDRIIRHNDGPLHWYCGVKIAQGNNPGNCGNHNYYWYEALKSDRFWIIPWDLDLAFGGNPSTALSGPWNSRSPNCSAVSFVGQRPAACDPLIYTWGGVTEPYGQLVEEMVSGPFSAQVVDGLLDEWTSKIDGVVTEAAELKGHLKVGEWRDAVAELRKIVDRQREQMSDIF